jgi:hypothetical protein
MQRAAVRVDEKLLADRTGPVAKASVQTLCAYADDIVRASCVKQLNCSGVSLHVGIGCTRGVAA